MEYKKGIEVPADMEHLDEVLDLVRNMMQDANVDETEGMKVEVCVEEMYTNIANYAYGEATGGAEVTCHVSDNPNELLIEFTDSGVPYNPLAKEDPNINAALEDRPIGGLGIYMTKKMMDNVSYEYRDGKNILTIKKKFS